MRHLRFYLQQASANLRHNSQRTLFVVFCIAVGVAAVVSLRTVGLMIGEGLTQNLQADNRGDFVIEPPFTDERFSESDHDPTLVEDGGEFSQTTFSALALERFRSWADENDLQMTAAIRDLKPASMYPIQNGDSAPVTAAAFFVEPRDYPYYGEHLLVDPAGVQLSRALQNPHSIVLNERLAGSLEVAVGDQIHIQGPEPFTVTGVIENGAEARLREMEAVVMPWALLRYEDGREVYGIHADTVYFKAPATADIETLTDDFSTQFSGVKVFSTESLRQQNQEISDHLTDLATVLGLLSLLIGGIGIVNTMLVVVGRRALEIGVLKTLGLQGRQITFMFLIEALALGILGSLAGAVLGLAMVSVLQQVAETTVSQALEFRLFPEAILMGVIIGVLVTLVFGFLPTLSAGRVRPAVVLRPNQATIPRAGLGLSTLVVILLTGIIGLLVGQILGKVLLGIGLAYAAMACLALATLILGGLVILLSRLPSFGNAYLKLSQRAIATHPGRAASTLLALVVGMFALSSILFMTNTLLNVINDVMEEQLGGDVIVVPESPESSAAAAKAIEELEGVESVTHQNVYAAKIVAIEGDRDMETLEQWAYDTGHAEANKDAKPTDPEKGEEKEDFDPTRFVLRNFIDHLSVSIRQENDQDYEIGEGRDLQETGGPEVVLRHTKVLAWLGISVGDTLTLQFGDDSEQTVTIAGIMAEPRKNDNFQVNLGEQMAAVASAEVVPEGTVAKPTPFIVDLQDDHLNTALRELSQIKGVFALHVSLINQLLTGIFQKLTALPLVVAILALFAGGVIIANTVSLAVLERRRQIGIMKALGMQASDVLKILLLENGIVGLIGGLIGTSIGAALILFTGLLAESPGSFPFGTMALLVLLAVAISLVATLLTAWGASKEKPLIVLRYE
jgi:putative ABC transport system permease protein